MYFLVYLLLCMLVAWLGRRKTIGFVGFLLLSLVITPAATFIILIVSADRDPESSIGISRT